MGILSPTGYKKKVLKQNYSNSQIYYEDYNWSPSTVRNILKNDIYIGNVTQGKRRVKSYKIHKIEQVPVQEWITVENVHKPIINKEIFYMVQNMSKRDTRVQSSGKLNMWAGILKCADCGHAMNKKYCKNKVGTVYEYYVCGTYRKKSSRVCTKHTIKIEELENCVLEAIKLHIKLIGNVDGILEKINERDVRKNKNINTENIKEIKEKEITKLINLKRCLYEDWKNEYITKEEYIEYKKKYEHDLKRIKEIIINLDEQKEMQEEIISGNSLWIEDFKKHKNITKFDRKIIAELIDYIEVHEDRKLTIHFKFANKI